VERRRGPSVRLKLTLSYAGFLMLAGVLMFVAAWLAGQPHNPFVAVLRYVPDEVVTAIGRIVPGNRGFLLRAYAPPAAVMLGFLLVFGLVGGWVLAGRMLAPLTRITAATRLAATGSLSHRIRLPGRHDELRQLADDFDAMLARLEAHVAEQRRFAANASHELRTPLTITRTLLEVAREDPDRDVDQLIERLQRINARAIELTEALLLLSRAEARAFERVPVDLSLIAEEVTETLLPLGERRRVSIETSGGAAPSIGSAALLQQMVMNLVHNAIVHNLADGGTVWVVTGVRDGRATLTVENTGEPLAAAVVATLTEPFQRGAGRIRTDHAGVGLGLAIVRRVVEVHDGRLVLEARPGGGLWATVDLPGDGPAV
jgi:two-component system sensor histidine kinase VanS